MFTSFIHLTPQEKDDIECLLKEAIPQGPEEWMRILIERKVKIPDRFANRYQLPFNQEVGFTEATRRVVKYSDALDAHNLKRVFVAEKNGQPIELNEVHVEAVLSPKMANARREVTPIPRLKSERMVPYVSIEDLESLVRRYGGTPELEALITNAWEGVVVQRLNDGQ